MTQHFPGFVALDEIDPPVEFEAPLPDAPPGANAAVPKPVTFTPSPFTWRDPAVIPRRAFVYGRHLTRGTVSATVSPGGVGKSALKLVDAVAMATGRDLLGDKPVAPLRVWYINLEDPREEIERRVAAICLHFRIKPEQLGDRLYFDGSDTCEVCIASQTKTGATIVQPVVDGLTNALKAGKFDVLMIDPFVSAHQVSENDNPSIDRVVKTLARIAGKTNTAIELVHHTRKTGGADVTAEDSRGGSATVNATRSTRVLNRMSADEATKLGVDEKLRRRTFRQDTDKLNLGPPEEARWFQIVSVALGNSSGRDIDDQDYVGVVDRWEPPNPLDNVTVAHLRAVQTKVAAGSYRKDPQSTEWVGRVVADVLDLDINDKAARAKVSGLLKTWTGKRMLKAVERDDSKRRPRWFVEVDEWAAD
jgi:hypothetical protein